MTVLVTGGCGYLGSRVVRDLVRWTDVECIRLLDNMQSGDHAALMDLPEEGTYEFLEGDILDPSVLRIALRDVELVVHLAAIAHTPFSFQDPNWVEQVNHWGTAHLVEACLSHDVEHLIYTSSGAVYGPGGPHDESDDCRPNGAYAHSKRQGERVVESAEDRGIDVTILRLGMMFGPAPVIRFDAVANKFAKLAGVGQPLTIYGDGSQTRPLLHVEDASDAVCWTIRHPEKTSGRCFNVVGRNASVNDLAEVVRRVRPSTESRRTEQDVRTHFSLELSPRSIEELGWEASRTLQEGFADLIERFRGFRARALETDLDL